MCVCVGVGGCVCVQRQTERESTQVIPCDNLPYSSVNNNSSEHSNAAGALHPHTHTGQGRSGARKGAAMMDDTSLHQTLTVQFQLQSDTDASTGHLL